MFFWKYRDLLHQVGVIIGLLILMCVVLFYQFTYRTPEDAERERARIMLQRIAALQHAYRSEYGTYLPIDEENNGGILQLNNAPGRFRYRVTVSEDGFMAYAEADFDRDGKAEVWVVDATGSDPVLKHED
jgi:type II secretory pathway pseudopilin PulG